MLTLINKELLLYRLQPCASLERLPAEIQFHLNTAVKKTTKMAAKLSILACMVKGGAEQEGKEPPGQLSQPECIAFQ